MQFGCNSVYTHFDGLNNFNLRECFHAIISLDKCINPNWDEWKKMTKKKRAFEHACNACDEASYIFLGYNISFG
jgi:hypothetical protein